MTFSADSEFDRLPTSAKLEINQLCDEFAAALTQDSPPDRQSYLDRVDPSLRSILTRELVMLEVEHYQRSQDEVPWSELREQIATEDSSWFATLMLRPEETRAERLRGSFHVRLQDRVGDYRLIRALGKGGMGTVYEAEHESMERRVAVKILRPELVEQHQATERFLREIRAIGSLEHPHIVRAYDAGREENLVYLVTEYLAGPDLKQLVGESGPLSWERAMGFVRQAAEALQFSHDRGIVHRDVKPANLMLDQMETLKLLDLGLAHCREKRTDDLTDANTLLGTAAYIAPEQATTPNDVDGRADVYSLGCTLFYLLTADTVFNAPTTLSMVQAHREQPPPDLPAEFESIPGANALFHRMLAKSPEQRFSSMRELIQQIDQLSQLTSGQEPSRLKPSRNKSQPLIGSNLRRSRNFKLGRLAKIAAIVVLLVGGSVIALDTWLIPKSRDWIAAWRKDGVRDDTWADWYATRPPRKLKTLPDFASYETGPWALEFNGEDSYVYFADPGPIPHEVTLEVIATLRLPKAGTLLRWFHEDETVAIGLSIQGELGLGRVSGHSNGTSRWNRPVVGFGLVDPPLDRPLHIAAQWDGEDYQFFINGQSQLTRTEYGGLFRGNSNGVFAGGVPRTEVNEPEHASPFAAAIIHEIRITRGLRYRDGFTPPQHLTRDATNAQQYVLLVGDFREKETQESLTDPLILSRAIHNAKWVRQPH